MKYLSIAQTPLASLFSYGIEIEGVEHILSVVRRHLGMDVAFVARFRSNDRILEYVDGENVEVVFKNQSIPLHDGYCQKVVNGELPELIPDTSKLPAAQRIKETHTIPIGSHISVPIRLASNQIYGTLCCFSHLPNAKLGIHELELLRAFSELLGLYFSAAATKKQAIDNAASKIRLAMNGEILRPVYQPIYEIKTGKLYGFECLSRFDCEPVRSPDEWFKSAHDVGMGLELERYAIDTAMDSLHGMSAEYQLSVNCSPKLILSRELPKFLGPDYDVSQITLEITEHSAVNEYEALANALAPLRSRGAKLAVDDAGAGYSSMRHILHLQPDTIKLDMSITRHVDTDRNRRALAKGLTSFAHEIGSVVVAEGVETVQELETLALLSVDLAQGFFFAKPMDGPEALKIARTFGLC